MKGKSDVYALANHDAPLCRMQEPDGWQIPIGPSRLDKLFLIQAHKVLVREREAEIEGIVGGINSNFIWQVSICRRSP